MHCQYFIPLGLIYGKLDELQFVIIISDVCKSNCNMRPSQEKPDLFTHYYLITFIYSPQGMEYPSFSLFSFGVIVNHNSGS